MLPYLVAFWATSNDSKNKSNNSKKIVPKNEKQPKFTGICKVPCNRCNSTGWLNRKNGLPIEDSLSAELENMFEDEPLYITCSNCSGSGYLEINKFRPCNKCCSRGWLDKSTGLPIEDSLDPEFENMFEDEPNYDICPNCLGTGYLK